MTVLSDRDIKRAVRNGPHAIIRRGGLGTETMFSGFSINPFNKGRVQPASYDVALSAKFRVFEHTHLPLLDPHNVPEGLTSFVDVSRREEPTFILHPGEFVLGATEEYIALGNAIVARIEGKSSLGRLGLVIHATAGWIDPGFHGVVTLEITNQARLPIVLRAGMLIGQLAFMPTSTQVERPYGTQGLGSKYQGDVEPAASRYSSLVPTCDQCGRDLHGYRGPLCRYCDGTAE